MEEDTGKSVHQTIDCQDSTLIDYNRSGVPLVEIVSEPDITSPEMAKNYLLKIQQIVRYVGVSDADIEKGSMRCEPTVNLKIEDNGEVFYTPMWFCLSKLRSWSTSWHCWGYWTCSFPLPSHCSSC